MVSPTHASSVLSRMMRPEEGDLPAQIAEYLEKLDFDESDHERIAKLASRAQEGTLSEAEQREYETYVLLDDFLALLRLKARNSRPVQSKQPKEPSRRGG